MVINLKIYKNIGSGFEILPAILKISKTSYFPLLKVVKMALLSLLIKKLISDITKVVFTLTLTNIHLVFLKVSKVTLTVSKIIKK